MLADGVVTSGAAVTSADATGVMAKTTVAALGPEVSVRVRGSCRSHGTVRKQAVSARQTCAATRKAHDALLAYAWPGNIRQLHNTIERLVILHRGRTVDLKHLPICITRGGQDSALPNLPFGNAQLPMDGIDLRNVLQQFEDSMIRQALQVTNGNKNQAAKILGLNRTTLVEKIKRYDLQKCA